MNHFTITLSKFSFLKKFIPVVALLLFGLQPIDLLANEVYKAILTGRHEVLPVSTPAHGSVTATLVENVLTVEGSFSGLTGDFAADVAGGSHIHMAYAGQNGGIQLRLKASVDDDLRGGTYLAADNTFTLTDEQIQALADRKFYVNIHTAASRSGELRGQLLPASEEYFYTNLLGSNEVPSIMSGGSGALALELNGQKLVVSGGFQKLEGTLATQVAGGAHLHLGFAGENGGIQLRLKATPSEDGKSGVFQAADNTFELSTTQLKALKLRQLYANIHSSVFRSGELRGQVLGMARTVFRAHLSGSNENPAVTSLASGVVMAELMADNRLLLSGAFAGLESKMALNIGGGAHVHRAMAGRNGPVMFRLFATPRGDLRSGAFRGNRNINQLSALQVEALYSRAFYVNIHTLLNRGGELRGQLLPESQIVFSGFLSSIFQTGGQVSTGSGGIKAELTGNRLTLSGSFQGLGGDFATQIAGGAHIHRGMAGANGPVTQRLMTTLDENQTAGVFVAANNVFELSEADIAELKGRGKYVNIHSQKYLPGEIRSPLLPEAAAYFVAPLSGASETTPVNSTGSGMTILEVTGNRGISSGSFNNLSAPLATAIAGGAHVHGALAGQNAGILFRLNSNLGDDQLSGIFPAADNVQSLEGDLVERLRDRATYVNIHSESFRSGELRGQLLPLATAYFTATLSGMNSIQPKVTNGAGQVKAELHGSELVLSGAFSGLTGDFATAVAGGSHLHAAAAGSNGSIRIFTNADLDADLKGGRFQAEDNTFDLNSSTLSELLAGELYLNLHSTTYRPGEIRGQLLGEINNFPTAEAMIESPASGAELTVAGDADTPFMADWSAAADRDELAYIWQLSTGEDFENLLVNQNVGNALSFTTDFATVDALLASAGLEIGESVTLFHRAVASDGSLATAGPAASVTLTRGSVGAGNSRLGSLSLENTSTNTNAFKVYPTAVSSRQSVFVDIVSSADQRAKMLLVNPIGQTLQTRNVDLFSGDNRMEWALPDLAAGFYFIQLQVEGALLPLQRIVVN